MRQLAETMATVAVWDQSAFNMEIFRAAYGQKVTAGVSVRVMSFLCFVNTKLLFKYMRYDPQLGNPGIHQPVTVHMNYHPEKEARMVDVNRFYHQRDRSALSRWNGGEGLSSRSCRGKVGVQTDKMPALQPSELTMHTLVKSLLARRDPWLWRGYGRIWFEDNGMLRAEAPLLSGATWGTVPSPWRKDALHIKVSSAFHCRSSIHLMRKHWPLQTPCQLAYSGLDGAHRCATRRMCSCFFRCSGSLSRYAVKTSKSPMGSWILPRSQSRDLCSSISIIRIHAREAGQNMNQRTEE